jgi:hypothetical protein
MDGTSRLGVREEGTGEDGQNSLMNGLDFPRLEHITGEQSDDEKHNEDKERP